MYSKEKQYKIAMILLCPGQGPWASSLVISYLYEILHMQRNNWMNIHLKRGKTMVYQDKIFTVNVGLS